MAPTQELLTANNIMQGGAMMLLGFVIYYAVRVIPMLITRFLDENAKSRTDYVNENAKARADYLKAIDDLQKAHNEQMQHAREQHQAMISEIFDKVQRLCPFGNDGKGK